MQIESSCIWIFLLPSHWSARSAFGFLQMHLNKYWKVLEKFQVSEKLLGGIVIWKPSFGCWIKNALSLGVSFFIFCFYLEIRILNCAITANNETKFHSKSPARRRKEVSNKYALSASRIAVRAFLELMSSPLNGEQKRKLKGNSSLNCYPSSRNLFFSLNCMKETNGSSFIWKIFQYLFESFYRSKRLSPI